MSNTELPTSKANQTTEQLAAVTDELTLVKQQLAHLVQTISTVTDLRIQLQYITIRIHQDPSNSSSMITGISVLVFQMNIYQY
jgi:ribosome maturation protein Sdo1